MARVDGIVSLVDTVWVGLAALGLDLGRTNEPVLDISFVIGFPEPPRVRRLSRTLCGLGSIVQGVPTIRCLNSVRRRKSRSVGVLGRAVASHLSHLRARVQPAREGRPRAVGKKFDDSAGLQVDEDRVVAVSTPQRPWGLWRVGSVALRMSRSSVSGLTSIPSLSLRRAPASAQTSMADGDRSLRRQSAGTARARVEQAREPLGECTSRTACPGAVEATH